MVVSDTSGKDEPMLQEHYPRNWGNILNGYKGIYNYYILNTVI